jgi:hypothetical protein
MAVTTDTLELKMVTTGADKMMSALAGVGTSLASLAVGGAFVGFLKDAAHEAMEAQDNFQRFVATAQATKTAFPIAEAQAYASQLQDMTTFTDDTVMRTMQLLMTFHMTERQIMGITPLLLDAAAALEAQGLSAEQAAVMIGKAFETGNMAGLKRFGITIDEQTFKVDRLKGIADGLRRTYGGVAQMMTHTLTGQMKQLTNQWEDMEKTVGGMLIPALTALMPIASGLLTSFSNLDQATGGWSTRLLLLAGTGGILALMVVQVVNLTRAISGLALSLAALEVFSGPLGMLAAIAGILGIGGAIGTLKLLARGHASGMSNGAGAGAYGGAYYGMGGATGNPAAMGMGGSGMGQIFRQMFGAGGPISQAGIQKTELPGLSHLKNNNHLTIRWENSDGSKLSQGVEDIIFRVLDKLNRHGALNLQKA